MQFFMLVIVLKVALILFGVVLAAMFAAEVFPVMAKSAISATNGTMIEMAGVWFAKALNIMAGWAHVLVDVIFTWIEAFGIDMSGVREMMEDSTKEASKAAQEAQ